MEVWEGERPGRQVAAAAERRTTATRAERLIAWRKARQREGEARADVRRHADFAATCQQRKTKPGRTFAGQPWHATRQDTGSRTDATQALDARPCEIQQACTTSTPSFRMGTKQSRLNMSGRSSLAAAAAVAAVAPPAPSYSASGGPSEFIPPLLAFLGEYPGLFAAEVLPRLGPGDRAVLAQVAHPLLAAVSAAAPPANSGLPRAGQSEGVGPDGYCSSSTPRYRSCQFTQETGV